MFKTRKEKNRDINEALQQVKEMATFYATAVDNVFTYSLWVNAMMPIVTPVTDQNTPLIKWFISHSLTYWGLFRDVRNDKPGIYLDKDRLVDTMSNSVEIENGVYSEIYTKDDALNLLAEMLKIFFDNKIVPVYDAKEKVEEDMGASE